MHLLFPLILAQTRAVPDTVVMLAPASGGLQQVLGIAELGMLILGYALVAAVVVAAIKMRTAVEKAHASLEVVGSELRELAAHANKLAQSVAAVAERVETGVESVHETVEYANRRARHAVTELADRVDAFNATVGMVQDTTQNGIVSAIAALRGVRAGMAALRKRPGKTAAPDEVVPASTPDAVPAPDLPARPRLRRRARGKA